MKKIDLKSLLLVIVTILVVGCNTSSSNKKTKNKTPADLGGKGTYGYDVQFLSMYHDVVELKRGNAAILIVPDYQGRVMTSTCEGEGGFSFGWINPNCKVRLLESAVKYFVV